MAESESKTPVKPSGPKRSDGGADLESTLKADAAAAAEAKADGLAKLRKKPRLAISEAKVKARRKRGAEPDLSPDVESASFPDLERLEQFDEDERGDGARASKSKKNNGRELKSYFDDISRVPMLTPATEYELARRIGIMEEVLWVQVLSYAPLTAPLADRLEKALGVTLPEFPPLRENAKALLAAGKVADRTLSESAGPVAAKLRQADIDRDHINAILADIKTVDTALKNGDTSPLLPISEDTPGFRNYVQGVLVIAQLIHRAKEEFVKANLRLVISLARRFNFGRMPLADLIQDGNMGLIKAVERFDYRRGFRFSTYAAWWIRHTIGRGLADKGRIVRLPVHMQAAAKGAQKVKQRLVAELGREPTPEELAAALGVKARKAAKLDSGATDDAVSLDRIISQKDQRAFLDFLQDETTTLSISERLISEGILAEVHEILQSLSPMEADILRLRFGFDSDEELTLQEIGKKHGLSRERIRQLQGHALARMKKALMKKDLL